MRGEGESDLPTTVGLSSEDLEGQRNPEEEQPLGGWGFGLWVRVRG